MNFVPQNYMLQFMGFGYSIETWGHCWSYLVSHLFHFCLLPQDLPNAMNAAEITDKLGLHSLRHRNWYIQATCATSGDGLYEGLDWLANQLKNKK